MCCTAVHSDPSYASLKAAGLPAWQITAGCTGAKTNIGASHRYFSRHAFIHRPVLLRHAALIICDHACLLRRRGALCC
jgi:hypothetical protein